MTDRRRYRDVRVEDDPQDLQVAALTQLTTRRSRFRDCKLHCFVVGQLGDALTLPVLSEGVQQFPH